MDLRASICEILSDRKAKREGLHVRHIARHIHNRNNNLFSENNHTGFDDLIIRVNRILAYDVRKKRKSLFMKVTNPKTGKYRKGVYKLKTKRSTKN